MTGVDTNILVYLEIAEMPQHGSAHDLFRMEVLDRRETIALAPQVLSEFVHIATDARRFKRPLTVHEALDKARLWWHAAETRHVFPTAASTTLFLEWMATHRLGRKRLLDTQLATTLWSAGVRRIMTGNAADFAIFGGFEILGPSSNVHDRSFSPESPNRRPTEGRQAPE